VARGKTKESRYGMPHWNCHGEKVLLASFNLCAYPLPNSRLIGGITHALPDDCAHLDRDQFNSSSPRGVSVLLILGDLGWGP
jgi:hypothetical protein